MTLAHAASQRKLSACACLDLPLREEQTRHSAGGVGSSETSINMMRLITILTWKPRDERRHCVGGRFRDVHKSVAQHIPRAYPTRTTGEHGIPTSVRDLRTRQDLARPMDLASSDNTALRAFGVRNVLTTGVAPGARRPSRG